jgi:hypothetical protein
MIALTDSSSSTSTAAVSFFAKLPIEILQHIAGYLVPNIYISKLDPLLNVTNLFDAYPSAFPFLKCFKNLIVTDIAESYPCIRLHNSPRPMTTELLESIIQSEPQRICIYSKKYFSTVLFAQFRKRTKVELWLGNVNLTSHDMNQILLALQSKNNNITCVYLSNNNLKVIDFFLLSKAIEHKNNRVDWLIIDNYEFNFEDTRAIANALIHPNCKLGTLFLRSNNGIGSDRKDLLMNAVATVRQKRTFLYRCSD